MINTLGIDRGINRERKIDIEREGKRWIKINIVKGEQQIDRQVYKEMESSKDNEIERFAEGD